MEIDGIINKILGSKKKREQYCSALLKLRWSEIAGLQIAKKSSPGRLDNGVLFLKVAGSAWAHNLLTMKKEFLAKINAFSPVIALKIKIDDIKIVNVAKIEEPAQLVQEAEELSLPDLTDEEISKIEEKVFPMQNQILASSISRIMIKDRKRQKYYWQTNGRRCEICGAVLSYKKKRCVVCEKDKVQKDNEKLSAVFYDLPWIEYQDAQKEVICSYSEFVSVQQECRQKFLLRALAKNAKNSDIRRYVMIKTGCPIVLLTEKIVDSTMEEARRLNHVPALGFRRHDPRY